MQKPPKVSKLPHLYAKLLAMMDGTTDRGKTTQPILRKEVAAKFRLSNEDLKIVMDELEDKEELTQHKETHPQIVIIGPPLAFIKKLKT